MGDGFKTEVRIAVQTVPDALKVPVSALFPAGVRAALYTVEEGQARQHEVEVLARNGTEAWIKSALAPGTAVILFPPATLREGQRVRRLANQVTN